MITIEKAREDYEGNGVAATFAYGFKISNKNQLKVTVRDDDGIETVLDVDTDFTVTGVGNKTGGNITLVDGPLTDEFLMTIERFVLVEQLADIRNQGDYYPEYIEDALDYQVMISQMIKGLTDRALKVSETTDLSTFDTTLPTVLGANRTVVVNEFGTALAAGPTIQELSDAGAAVAGATAAAAAAASSASAASASATSAMTSATNASNSATAASGSASAAATSASNAATSETNAAASAVVAAAHDILYGSGAPGSGLGVDGNSYIDTASGSFYQKGSGAWTLRVTLTGSAGVSTFNGRGGAVVPVAGDYTKGDVGLGNVDNTSDANKPISTATQTALDGKLAIASNLSDLANAGTARTNLGLGNVDDTSDADKPISTATQTALNDKADAAAVTSALAGKANLAGGNTFSGVQTLGGDLITQAYIKKSTNSSITAFAGGGQASATQLSKDVNWLTTVATNGDSVKLPAGIAGMEIFIQNNGAANANVYPASGELIDNEAANGPVALNAGTNVKFICVVAGTWKSQAGASAGGGSPLSTKGDIYVYSTANTRFAVGADGKTIVADSGTATGLKWGELPISGGGTGQSTKAGAFDALSPMSASGDIIYGGASGTGTRLPKGADGKVLILASGLPSWGDAPAGFTGRAGVEALSNAVSSVAVVFSTALANNNYAATFNFINTTDSDLAFIQGMITAKSASGFTVSFNTPTDSANYSMGWNAIPNV